MNYRPPAGRLILFLLFVGLVYHFAGRHYVQLILPLQVRGIERMQPAMQVPYIGLRDDNLEATLSLPLPHYHKSTRAKSQAIRVGVSVVYYSLLVTPATFFLLVFIWPGHTPRQRVALGLIGQRAATVLTENRRPAAPPAKTKAKRN